jgi:hypothetical protein
METSIAKLGGGREGAQRIHPGQQYLFFVRKIPLKSNTFEEKTNHQRTSGSTNLRFERTKAQKEGIKRCFMHPLCALFAFVIKNSSMFW